MRLEQPDLSGQRVHPTDSIAPPSSRSIVILDFLRWLSALEVMVSHVRDLFFVDFRDTVSPGLALKLFYFVTGYGYEAVMIFFVLSGFLVGGKVMLDQRAARFSWFSYLIDRFSRIYLVLVPALLLTLLCDRLGAHLFAHAPAYDGSAWSPALNFDYRLRGGWTTFSCNLANLQFVACPAYGSNGPLWSLAMEWVYYLTFPILLVLLRGPKLRVNYACRVAVVALAAAIGCRYASGLILLYPVWLMGVVARFAVGRIRLGWPVVAAATAALLVSLTAKRFGLLLPTVGDYAIGASVALLISSAPLLGIRFAARLNKALADFSYSLYAAHFPLVLFILAGFQEAGRFERRVPVSPAHLAVFVGAALAVYGATYLLARATERHTATVRQWLKRRLAGAGAGALP